MRGMHLNVARRLLLCSLVAASPLTAQGRGGRGQAPPPPPLQFQLLGPSAGGRVSAVTGVPGDLRTWYVGGASGGVWKSTDDGNTFTPIFDKQSAQAIGALAVAPSDPNQVWAGTGEPNSRNTIEPGAGVYKSTDGGKTWKKILFIDDKSGVIEAVANEELLNANKELLVDDELLVEEISIDGMCGVY